MGKGTTSLRLEKIRKLSGQLGMFPTSPITSLCSCSRVRTSAPGTQKSKTLQVQPLPTRPVLGSFLPHPITVLAQGGHCRERGGLPTLWGFLSVVGGAS